jgi:hypothetical protein
VVAQDLRELILRVQTEQPIPVEVVEVVEVVVAEVTLLAALAS